MMYQTRRRKPEPTLLPTLGIFNFPHNIGMVWEWIAAQLNVMAVAGFVPLSPGSPTQRHNQLSYLPIRALHLYK